MALKILKESGRKKIGCLGAIIIIVLLMMIGVKVIDFFEKRSEDKKRVEHQKLAAQVEEKKRTEFISNLEQHYQKLLSFQNEKNFSQATKELQLFRKYQEHEYKDVPDIEKRIRIATLENEVKAIPASKAAENLRIYKNLLSLDPENSRYKNKVALYQAKVDDQERKVQEAEMVRQKRIARFGEPPVNSAWDGSVRCVKEYLKEIARDPDTVKFEKWGKVSYNEQDGWLVWCQFRGKNAFGGYVRDINWFVIRHGRVVAMKDFNTYQ